MPFGPGFLWGASTAPHQVEGNNVNSDWWVREQSTPGMEPSGDALDSYHRYEQDMDLLADAGLNAYRFGIEWSRIEPAPGRFSRAELAHYRRMIDAALARGLTPVVTLHHFSSPRWLADIGEGWLTDAVVDRFARYVAEASTILDGVEWVCTINEPNMFALLGVDIPMPADDDWQSPTLEGGEAFVLPDPDPVVGARLIAAHVAARSTLRERTGARVGWTIASQALSARPGAEETLAAVYGRREDPFLVASRDDDFVGVQSYTANDVDAGGVVPNPPSANDTQTGMAFRPDAVGIAARHAWDVAGVPVLVTENGIATEDDERRVAFLTGALASLAAAAADGVDVRGYLHWSLLDNYEWGHWGPTFGLATADRLGDFARTPKPSLAALGEYARGIRRIA